MRDLKDLLDPLTEREMPDRWDEIERRQVRRLDEPGLGSRVPAYAISFAVIVVVGLVVARLLPLGDSSEPTPGVAGDAPPSWLVDTAYRLAYSNGDLTPTSAEWVQTTADAIAPAVGLASGAPTVPEYLVVLHGDFTAYMASVPSGAATPTGSVLSFAVGTDSHDVTDWGVGDRNVSVPGLQPFDLPDPSQTYTDPGGWRVAVPPGWSVQPFDLSSPNEALKGAMISSVELPPPVAARGTLPQADGNGFPDDAVAMVVSTEMIDWGGERVWQPPLSIQDFTNGSALAGNPTLDTLKFANDQQGGSWFTATIKTGERVSAIDESAVASVVASLTFEADNSSPAPVSGEDRSSGARSPSAAATPCTQLVPNCQAVRLQDITLTDGATHGALGPVDGMDLGGIISFDDALRRAGAEDGYPDAETVQVTLGSANADDLHWGHGTNLYYVVDWEGVCIQGSGPSPVSGESPPSQPACGASDWGTVIDAHSGGFIVGGT
jgi:hypothetical protein